MDEETVFCKNCQRDIPASNFMMHSVHCIRKISLCPRCNDPVPRTMLQEHEKTIHSSATCRLCGKKMEKWQVAEHRESLCQQRMIGCQFCDLECTASDLKDHENYCGSRTERCPDCGEYVMLKYQQIHMDSSHNFLKLGDEPGIRNTWQKEASTVANKPSASLAVQTAGAQMEKVFSGSDDTARMAPTVNRLSPSKRTNDKPQINSSVSSLDTKSDVKDKVNIYDFMTDQEVAAEFDHLYACQLEQQEQQLQLCAAVEPGLLGDSQEYFGEEMRLKSDHTGDWNPPLFNTYEWLRAGDRGSAIKNLLTGLGTDWDKLQDEEKNRMKAEVGMKVEQHGQPAVTTMVELPCEFCDIMIPEQQLIEHQSMCRPDLLWGAPLNNFGEHEEELKPLEVHPARQPAVSPQVEPQQLVNDLYKDSSPAVSIEHELALPCEFCSDLFPGEFLIQHQMVCDLNVNAIPLATFDDENRPPETQSRKAVARSPLRQSQHRQPGPAVPSHFLADSESEDMATSPAKTDLVNYNVGANNKKVVEKEKFSPLKENLSTKVKTVLISDNLSHTNIKNVTCQREKNKYKNTGLQPYERIIHNSLNGGHEVGDNSYLSEMRAALQPTQWTTRQGAQRTESSNIGAGARPKGQKKLAKDFLIEGRNVVSHDRKEGSHNRHRSYIPDTPVLSSYQLETESDSTVTVTPVRHSSSLYDVAHSAPTRRAGNSPSTSVNGIRNSASVNGIRNSASVYGIKSSYAAGASPENSSSTKKTRAALRRT